MFSHSSTKQLNRKAYNGYHKDGIIDLLVGLTLLGFGLWLLFDNVLFTYISWLSFGFYGYLKKTITIPRFGYVRFEEDRKQKYLMLGFGIILLVFLLVARFTLLDRDSTDLLLSAFLRKNHVYIMGSIGAGLLLIYGLVRGIYRFAAYGISLFTTLMIFYLQGIPGRNAFFLVGGIVLIIGVVLLILFTQSHPSPPQEVDNAVQEKQTSRY